MCAPKNFYHVDKIEPYLLFATLLETQSARNKKIKVRKIYAHFYRMQKLKKTTKMPVDGGCTCSSVISGWRPWWKRAETWVAVQWQRTNNDIFINCLPQTFFYLCHVALPSRTNIAKEKFCIHRPPYIFNLCFINKENVRFVPKRTRKKRKSPRINWNRYCCKRKRTVICFVQDVQLHRYVIWNDV